MPQDQIVIEAAAELQELVAAAAAAGYSGSVPVEVFITNGQPTHYKSALQRTRHRKDIQDGRPRTRAS